MNLSIRQRIHWSFSLLVGLFVVNGIITVVTLNRNGKLSSRLSQVVDPSLQSLDEFRNMMLESKMYSTNWVFLRYKQEDKDMLVKLHEVDYAKLKAKLSGYAANWSSKSNIDSLQKIFVGFEKLLAIEKTIMQSLRTFNDYDDPVIKLQAEWQVEQEILPRTDALMSTLDHIHSFGVRLRAEESAKLERTAMRLRLMIVLLAAIIVLGGFLLARYMTKIIVSPINRIRDIVSDLGRGVMRKTEYTANGDEIGKMIASVNSLSANLQSTTSFAHEIGRRNFDMPFVPLSDEDTLGKSLLAMRDNLRANENDLAAQNRELERKNKELEQFAYVASHDLQEPLRTTSGFVDLLCQQYKNRLDEKADKYLSYISQSASRMRVLIADLLEYSRIGNKQEFHTVDCNAVLNDVVADLAAVITETGATISVDRLPVIKAYPVEIKLLFQNLILNAIKFRRKDVAPNIVVRVARKGNAWQFMVSDNGIGIAREYHERIFIIFQRLHTRSEYDGTGIGLSHCKKIVELHKGKIWLDSELGRGSTFYFTIPEPAEAA
jgi:signal transduction histidine kinase